jgi:hypothetical protein
MERYDVASNTWRVMADMLEWLDAFCVVTVGSVDPAEE